MASASSRTTRTNRQSQQRSSQQTKQREEAIGKQSALAAVEQGNTGTLLMYLRRDGGHEICDCGSNGQPTMLQVAARRGDFEMTELLIDYGCTINAQLEETGDTPLMMALDGGHVDVANLLIRHEKCDYNAQNKAGYTALMKAAMAGLTGPMEQLLRCSPDMECRTSDVGHTALSLAVLAGQPEAVRLLMEFGANPKHTIQSGQTVESLAWDLPESRDQQTIANKRQICEALMKNERGPARRLADGRHDTPAALIGQRYKNLALLGDGAHGLALLVRDMRSNCDAEGRVKVLKKSSRGARAYGAGNAALQEISMLKQLHHSCVLEILDYFTDADTGSVCIVTDYCELRDMQLWVHWCDSNNVAMPARLVKHWFVQMLLGLHYLHDRRIIHRDLKPSNVFVKADATVCIGDFGCATKLVGRSDCARTISGTWIYMSPEVLRNEGYGSECDMWSLGCTLYELCNGQPMFDASAASRAELYDQICHRLLPSLMAPQSSMEEASEAALPSWLGEAFSQLTVRQPVSQRASAASLLGWSQIRFALHAMDTEALASDRAFLSDNRAGIVDDVDGQDSWHRSRGSGDEFIDAYDQLLANTQWALQEVPTTASDGANEPGGGSYTGSSDDNGADAATELEHLRSQLTEKKELGFPLDQVVQVLATSVGMTQEEKLRQLKRVTQDLEACEMVELAMLLEQQYFPEA